MKFHCLENEHVYTYLIPVYEYYKFDYSDGLNSNGHNSLNINSNEGKFVFKLKPKMSTSNETNLT